MINTFQIKSFNTKIKASKFRHLSFQNTQKFQSFYSSQLKNIYEIPINTYSKRNYTKIYTKTGDKGTSALYSGERRLKTDDRFQSLGHVDELNANIGLAREWVEILKEQVVNEIVTHSNLEAKKYKELSKITIENALLDIRNQLEEIQSRLLDIGSSIATPLKSSKEHQLNRVQFSANHISNLEQWIDSYDDNFLPPLKNFILPSGGLASSQLHVCRTICRRAERSIVPLLLQEDVDDNVLKYMNRLSDYLFTIARVSAICNGKPEVIYKKEKLSNF